VILVDSSVWIDYFNGKETAQTLYLRDTADRSEIVVGDLVLCEVLQGFCHNRDLESARGLLLAFQYRDIVGKSVALQAAANYPALRGYGVTIRKTIDVLIATFCMVNGLQLLHADADVDPMERHLGLRVIHADGGAAHTP